MFLTYSHNVVVGACVALAGSYLILRIIYNLFFHPLAKIPGPKLPAATSLWLFYSDFRGHACDDIFNLHKQYGKISPDEVSIKDIDAFHKDIYAQNTKFQKSAYYYHAFHSPDSSVFSETNKEIHAKEKRLMSHAFSRANLVGYQKNMYENTASWIGRLKSYANVGRVIPLWHATQCLTLDTVSGFSFGSKAGALEAEDFYHPLFVGFETFAPLVVLFQQFPLLKPIFGAFQKFMSFGFGPINQSSAKALDRLNEKKGRQEEDSGMIMFDSMVARAESNGIHISPQRLVQNGSLMLGAGTGTTALVLTTAIYHLNAQPEVWKSLQSALLDRFPDFLNEQPDVVQLEKVPLLEACIKEAMRVSIPIRGRWPREVPKGGLDIHGLYISEGYSVCSSALLYCNDPDVFPEPDKFKPERWLDAENAHDMQRNLVVFSHGSRACIGQNFAQIELKIALSQVVMNLSPGKIVDQELGFHAHSITSPDGLADVTLRLS
ncbi:benzoate 4-monooxygenase cytochrome p450 [Colletotrichum karsti]|uniref:Benzoate 4-monooxygenase cytochrome p450 n=1 Tax=Colletotrichum karsti TaxID=1095194 RepID=A0A9P6I1F2_9PEZI|nr:benzoate 4-monooxygenase cytochrome p450 [Colletotrichum karsti]KAF9874489.1 benzoate 4-monooxygenase cytochrome p450 [Colletotrichum karsti]